MRTFLGDCPAGWRLQALPWPSGITISWNWRARESCCTS